MYAGGTVEHWTERPLLKIVYNRRIGWKHRSDWYIQLKTCYTEISLIIQECISCRSGWYIIYVEPQQVENGVAFNEFFCVSFSSRINL